MAGKAKNGGGKKKVRTNFEAKYSCPHCGLADKMRYAEYHAHCNKCEKKLKAKSAAEKVKAEAAAANSKKNRGKN